MSPTFRSAIAGLAALAVTGLANAQSLYEADTRFTYQGLLELNGAPYSGPADLTFRLADLPGETTGTIIAQLQGVQVEDGLITALLQLPEPLANAPAFINVAVSAPPGEPFQPLLPNQRITATPLATQAEGARLLPDGTTILKTDRDFSFAAFQSRCDALLPESTVYQSFTTPPTVERVEFIDLAFFLTPNVPGQIRVTIYEGDDEGSGPVFATATLDTTLGASNSGLYFVRFPGAPELAPDTVYHFEAQTLDNNQNPVVVEWCVASNNYAGGGLLNGPADTDLDFAVVGYSAGEAFATVGRFGEGHFGRSVSVGSGTINAEISVFDPPGEGSLKLASPSNAYTLATSSSDLRLTDFDGTILEYNKAFGRVHIGPDTVTSSDGFFGGATLVVEDTSPQLSIAGEAGSPASIRMLRIDETDDAVDGWITGLSGIGGNLGFDALTSTGTFARRITVTPGGAVGLNDADPLGALHINAGAFLDATALNSTDIIVQDDDAVLGLFSTPGGNYGSAISLGQLNGTGGISNQWAIVRETTQAGDNLEFRFGTGRNYADNGTNPVAIAFRTNGTIFQASSADLKRDVEEIKNALDTILAMRGVTYTWKRDGEADLGFIAEEMAEVLPEIVNFDNGKPTGIDYGRITALLVEAVKEQQLRMDGLESRLGAIESILNAR